MEKAVGVKNEKQIFVRNLAFDTKEEDLIKLFEAFGPIKNVTISTSGGKSKGFGFVKFALEVDAENAIKSLNGTKLQGRKIKLEFGLKKPRHSDSKQTEPVEEEKKQENNTHDDTPVDDDNSVEEEEEEEEKEDQNQNQIALEESKEALIDSKQKIDEKLDDDNAKEEVDVGDEQKIKRSRQIIVLGVPVDINKKQFKMVVAKVVRTAEIELIKEDHVLAESLKVLSPGGKVMLITTKQQKDAKKLLEAFNNDLSLTILKSVQAVLKKLKPSEDKASKPKLSLFARSLAELTELEHRKRKCRLIIRNLSFQATEQNVLDKMSKFGPVVSIEIPTTVIEKNEKEDEEEGSRRRKKGKGGPIIRPKGFGFVTFLCENDAKNVVLSSTPGKTPLKVCNREVAIDFCMSKETYVKYGQPSANEPNSKTDDEAKTDDDDVVADASNPATEKDDVDENEDDENNDDTENMDVDDDNDDENNDKSDDDQNDDHEEASDDDAEDDDDDAESEGEEEEERVTEKPPVRDSGDVKEGTTVFLRGIPFDAEVTDIKKALRSFGKIFSAVIVKDSTTQLSKGCAFVKFSQREEAERCVEAGAAIDGKLGAPADGKNKGIMVKDRLCKVDYAVDRKTAQEISESKDKSHKKDKRNLYLANEGLILNDNKSTLSPEERAKREKAQNEKRKKLVNPLFFVSATRLSVRNLSKSVTDKELRQLCLTATHNGLKKGLVTLEDLKAQLFAQEEPLNTIKDQVQKGIPLFRPKIHIKKAKIMYDSQKVKGGAPQSRGFGFIEFEHHLHALACVREISKSSVNTYRFIPQSPAEKALALKKGKENAGGKNDKNKDQMMAVGSINEGRLIIEFSVEDFRKVKILQQREMKNKEKRGDIPTKKEVKKQVMEEKLQHKKRKINPATVEDDFENMKKMKIEDISEIEKDEVVNVKLQNKKLERERKKRKKMENSKNEVKNEETTVEEESTQITKKQKIEKKVKNGESNEIKEKSKENGKTSKKEKNVEINDKKGETTGKKNSWGGHKRLRAQKKMKNKN